MTFEKLENTFQAFLDLSVDAAAVVDDNGYFLLWNKQFEDLLDEDTLADKNCYQFTHPDDIDLDKKLHQQCIKRERDSYIIHKRYITKKEKIIYVRLTVKYVCGIHECFSIAVATNITVEHEIEETAKFRHALLNAIDNDEFILHYQPIIALKDNASLNVKTNDIFAYEALVRWQKDEVLCYPDSFLSTLRLLGMEHQLCKLILDIAIKKISETNKRVCINIEPLTLSLDDFSNTLFEILKKYNVTNLSLVILEIVESEALDEILEEKLKFLYKNFLISLDDWGSKYNNLVRVATLPVHLIKLDKSLLSNKIVVERSLDLIHDLGLMAIAEGVETEEQANWLKTIGCDFGQGWYYGMPCA